MGVTPDPLFCVVSLSRVKYEWLDWTASGRLTRLAAARNTALQRYNGFKDLRFVVVSYHVFFAVVLVLPTRLH